MKIKILLLLTLSCSFAQASIAPTHEASLVLVTVNVNQCIKDGIIGYFANYDDEWNLSVGLEENHKRKFRALMETKQEAKRWEAKYEAADKERIAQIEALLPHAYYGMPVPSSFRYETESLVKNRWRDVDHGTVGHHRLDQAIEEGKPTILITKVRSVGGAIKIKLWDYDTGIFGYNDFHLDYEFKDYTLAKANYRPFKDSSSRPSNCLVINVQKNPEGIRNPLSEEDLSREIRSQINWERAFQR